MSDSIKSLESRYIKKTTGPSGFPLARSNKFGSGGLTLRKARPLVGTFEENILNHRLEPIRTVEGFVADVRASCNLKQPNPIRRVVRMSFYSVDGCFPYLGQVNLDRRGYKIPRKGTLQVTLFNPNGTIVKLFLLNYDLTDMPPNSQTFLRQKTFLLPSKLVNNTTSKNDLNRQQLQPNDILCDKINKRPIESESMSSVVEQRTIGTVPVKSRVNYLIQLNIVSSKSGRIYLNKDLRIFISKKIDLETASQLTKQDYEMKAFDEMPSDPKYFSR